VIFVNIGPTTIKFTVFDCLPVNCLGGINDCLLSVAIFRCTGSERDQDRTVNRLNGVITWKSRRKIAAKVLKPWKRVMPQRSASGQTIRCPDVSVTDGPNLGK
jgi:hypothetical protein